ncbi:MarR family transcriptional regulator [Candidatus Bipolaricaulota bacterium]|nr:MarR family transcriptional regulator [Candidatus Bipolaricaulota bacterium]
MTHKNKVLTGLKSGKTPDQLAEELEMRKQTISAIIELLVHQGLVKEIDCSSACESCIMGKSCPGSGRGREKVYIVDEDMEV